MNSRHISTVLLFFLSLAGSAQTVTIESLKKKLAVATDDAQKTSALLALCQQRYSLNADSIYTYATSIKKINTNAPEERPFILADYYIAYSLLINGHEDSSLQITNRYIEKLKTGNSNTEAYMLYLQLKGLTYYRRGKSKESINTFFMMESEAKKNYDTLSLLIAHRGISLAYILTGQDQEALKVVHNTISIIPDKLNDKYREIYGLLKSSASVAFLHLHQASGLPLYADSCAYYANGAIELGKKTDNLFLQCQGYIAKGLIMSYQKKMTDAEQNLQEGLKVRQIIGDTLYIISDMSVLASFYANTKQMEKGVAICYKGIELASRRKVAPLLMLLYNSLAENYKSTGHYKEYAAALKLQMTVKDSLNKKNSSEELKTLQAENEAQKNETTIIEQKLKLTKKNYWLFGSVLFALMLATIGWLAFKVYRRRQRLKMEVALAGEKKITALAIRDAEEQERIRIAADLHDNLGAYAASLSSNLSYIQPAPADSITNNAYTELKNNSNAIISELNDTIWVLKKESLSLTAISDRLKIFIERIRKSYPAITIEVIENIGTDYLLSSSQAFNLYRVMQEAINNSLKHSKGKNVVVKIEAINGWIVSIEDDGTGFKTEGISSEDGNGLQNIKSRCNEAGWDLAWLQRDGGGTAVQISSTAN